MNFKRIPEGLQSAFASTLQRTAKTPKSPWRRMFGERRAGIAELRGEHVIVGIFQLPPLTLLCGKRSSKYVLTLDITGEVVSSI